MQVTVIQERVNRLLDTLLKPWRAEPKQFPFNKWDAVVPQKIIPPELRANKHLLACFYFYVCIYMRGGIESMQAFTAIIRMWRDHPYMFDPLYAQWLEVAYVQRLLRQYVGWDSHSAAVSWIENSRRLIQFWDGKPLNLLKGLRDYEEACRRIRNKHTKRERLAAGPDGLGFRGFQEKMVSMLLYFYDWEGWFEEQFLYPSPSDFHNFRLGFNQGAIVLSVNLKVVTPGRKIGKAWRDAVMEYMRTHNATPVEVSDVLWLFSLVMCGNSPINNAVMKIEEDKKQERNGSGVFEAQHLPHDLELSPYLAGRYRNALNATCMRCPLLKTCSLAIPSKPYYRKTELGTGVLVLYPRPRIEEHLPFITGNSPPRKRKTKETAKALHLFEPVG